MEHEVPTPLSKKRIMAAFEQRNWRYWVDSDGDLGGSWDDNIYTYLLCGQSDEMLVITGRYHTPLSMNELDTVRSHIVDWHRNKLWPKCYHRIDDEGRVRVFTEVGIDHEHGVTDEQLMSHLCCALSSSGQFFDSLTEALRA